MRKKGLLYIYKGGGEASPNHIFAPLAKRYNLTQEVTSSGPNVRQNLSSDLLNLDAPVQIFFLVTKLVAMG